MPITDMHVQMKAFVALGGPGVGGGYWDERRSSAGRSTTVVLTLINSLMMNRVRLTLCCYRDSAVECLHPVTLGEETSCQSSNWDKNVKRLPSQCAWRRLF